MLRSISIAIVLAIFSFSPALAQTEDEVAAARQLYIDGQHEAALLVLLPAAEAGNARAQNIVGAAYQYGNGGLPVDVNLALQYFGLSAAQDFPSSHHNLGVLYENGMPGLEPDPEVARVYYEKSYAIGWVGSYADLARMLRDGIGGPVDIPRAIGIIEQGIVLNDPNSIHAMAYMTHQGLGVPVDLVRSRALYARSAATGVGAELGAVNNDYGVMLEVGQGGPVDLQGAMTQYQAGMEADFAYAGINAAWLVFENPQVFPDQVQGLAYCFWAADHAAGPEAEEYRISCDEAASGYSKAEVEDALKQATLLFP